MRVFIGRVRSCVIWSWRKMPEVIKKTRDKKAVSAKAPTKKHEKIALFDKNTVSALPKVSVGILVYKGERYFHRLFESLFAQDFTDLEILVLDNASPKNDGEFIREHYGERVKVVRSAKNLGFAKGHNLLINEARGEFYLCLNQDMFLDNAFIGELVKAIQKNAHYGSATGKIYRWDFEWDKKTDQIDTVGIKAFASHHFRDEGQGQKDGERFSKPREIFGASGAAALYRRKALKEVAINGREYFDELFFMYKEDIDLAYRLQWLGWKCVYAPRAEAWHDRTIAQCCSFWESRKRKPLNIRKWSYLNQKLLIYKNFSLAFSWATKARTFFYHLAAQMWVLLFERDLLAAEKEFQKLVKKVVLAEKRAAPAEIEKFFV